MTQPYLIASRPHFWFFVFGCIAVTGGVLMHLLLYWMGHDIGFHLADMPTDTGQRIDRVRSRVDRGPRSMNA